jgi:MFS family permease
MGDMVIIPVAENLFKDFAGVNMGILNFILSGPALIAGFTALLCGRLLSFVSKKNMLITGFCLFMVGSIGGDFVHNAYYMVAMRTLVGIAMGMMGVTARSIIASIFIDEKARSSVMGVYSGLMAAVGALLGWVSGMVAAIEWRLVFRIYLASIPILLMIAIFIPHDKAQKSEADSGTKNLESEKMPWLKLMLSNGAYVVFTVIYCIVYYQVAMVIADKAIGDVSLVGLLSALGTVGSAVFCTFFGLYYNKLKRFTPFVGFTGLTAGFLLLYFGNTPLTAAISCTLLGSMYGLGLCYYSTRATLIVPPGQIPMALSVTSMMLCVGTALSTYISLLLQWLFKTSITGIIPVLAIVLAVGAVLSFIMAFGSHKSEPAPLVSNLEK